MSEIYWELDSIVDNLARAHLFLISQRRPANRGEFYGPSHDPWCQFVLTYNVIESIHSLGFPLDSPRLQRALDWMKANVDSVEVLGDSEAVLGKLFLLKSFQYMPGFKNKFKDKLDTLPAFIEKNLKNNKAEMLPFMVLDSFIENELKYEELIKKTFKEIELKLENHKNEIGKLSYAFFLSYKYLKSGCKYDGVLKVNKLSGQMLFNALEANSGYSNIFNESCYCLLNLGRIEVASLNEYKLENHLYLIREWAIKYLANNTNNICYNKNIFNLDFADLSLRNSLPKEIAEAKDKYVNIYMVCIIMRAISESSPDPKQLKLAVAHNQLKIIYENFFDPVYKKFKMAKIFIAILIILLPLFAFNYISFTHINFVVEVKGFIAKIFSSAVRDKLFYWAGGIAAIAAILGFLFVAFKNVLPFVIKKVKR